MSTALVVSEVFGPTWQGEGPSLGRRAGFVRLGRCSLACRWCDTPYTWDWTRFDPAEELSTRATDDIVADLEAMSPDLVVVTGGEPLLQQRHLPPLLAACRERQWAIEIETAGTVMPQLPADLVDRFNVSPKLATSGNSLRARYHPEVLAAFEATGRAAFKFVVTGEEDLDEIDSIVGTCGLTDVWVMPEGTDADALLHRTRALAGAVLERGYHLTTRLHVLVWGDERGR